MNDHFILRTRLRDQLTSHGDLQEKRMFGGTCFMLNQQMCCGITGDGRIMIRVGPERYEQLLAKPGARPMNFTGRPMRGFLFIDEAACQEGPALAAWLEPAIAHALSLPPKKPKPTKSVKKVSVAQDKPIKAQPRAKKRSSS